MRIAFATSQSAQGSTNLGRITPLAEELNHTKAECWVLVNGTLPRGLSTPIHWYRVGSEPFRRTPSGKVRLKGLALILNMVATSLRTTMALHRIRPDVVVISKPLPANTLGVRLYSLFGFAKIVLDADDFELTANKLSSLYQRAAIHWSERLAARLANSIIVASPFLSDHFKQLTQNKKVIQLIPTGLTVTSNVSVEQTTSATLAYFGSVSVSSGHRVDLLPDILEQARRRREDLRLLIAGDGDDVAGLREEFQRRELGAYVTWLGRFSLAELDQFLTTGTILLDPVDDSIANRAKSSFRVMLAAALGLPVVTSNIGIRPRLLPSHFHDRFFADSGDSQSYAGKCVALAQQPLTDAERQHLRSHAEPYTWAKLAARYYEILKA